MPGRGGAAQNRRAFGEADLGLLHPEQAGVLDDHDQSVRLDTEPGLALTEVETGLLDQLVPDKDDRSPREKTLSGYLTKIARLGGYLARASDPPPGNTVMWRGLSRLTDTKLGATLGAQLVGN